jgi:1,4-alpha-glucan branching enzyme
MVMALHNAGLRVVQDTVFNHTNASGEGPNSILDEIDGSTPSLRSLRASSHRSRASFNLVSG